MVGFGLTVMLTGMVFVPQLLLAVRLKMAVEVGYG